jgi:hypothetical protein
MKGMLGLLGAVLALGVIAVAGADVNAVTPSTNDINRTNGWAHVDQLSQGIGTTKLQFISTRNFYSCFEYRTDGDTSQVLSENGGNNYNTDITDGLYPYVCENNSSTTMDIHANAYVEVRMVFGAERDERFDWTRFNVLQDAQTKAECKKNGWQTYGFRNQGQCVRFIETGKDSREPQAAVEGVAIPSSGDQHETNGAANKELGSANDENGKAQGRGRH